MSTHAAASTPAQESSAQANKQKKTTPSNKKSASVSDKQSDLNEVRGQIKSLRKEMAVTETQRNKVADELKGVEQDIKETETELNKLSAQHNKLQSALKELNEQSQTLEAHLKQQQTQLEILVYRQYQQGNPDAFRLLLNGDDPNQITRDLYYLQAIGRERSRLLQDIQLNLQRKKKLTGETENKAKALADIEHKQKDERQKLVMQREQRQTVLKGISTKISDQKREINNLVRDEKELSRLVDQLAKKLAAQAAKTEREGRSREKQATQSQQNARTEPNEATGKSSGSGRASPSEINNERMPEAMPAGNFAQLKGQLHLPTRGVVTNRFGSPRQEGSNWKGLFIRASNGSPVKAIAAGRIVFSEEMRGFGNLIIVDHGNSYLSIYGNNEALLKKVGENVRGGDSIASVGNSGSNPESGLYFELRYQGKPQDPLQWVTLK